MSYISKSAYYENDSPIQTFKQIIRTYMLRMLAMLQQSSKFALMYPPDQLDQMFSRLLHGSQIKQSIIYELTNAQIKSDQHFLLVLTLLHDLAQWAYDCTMNAINYSQNFITKLDKFQNNDQYIKDRFSPIQRCLIENSTIQCIINQSLTLLRQQKKHEKLITKQNQLIRILLQLIPLYIPIYICKTITPKQNHLSYPKQQFLSLSTLTQYNKTLSQYFQNYFIFYSMLKQIKQSYSSTSKDQLKKYFNKGIQDTIKTIQHIFTFIDLIAFHINIDNIVNINKNQQLVLITEICYHNLKFIEKIHSKISQDLYKILNVFSTLNLSNSLNNSQVTSICNNKFPQITLLYNCNFNQMILSNLKILKQIISLISSITTNTLTLTFQNLTQKYHSTITKIFNQQNQFCHLLELSQKLQYHEYLLHKTSHLLIQVNYYCKISNYYIFGIIYTIYDSIMKLLIKRDSMVPLYLYTHIVINNLKKVMDLNANKYTIKTTNYPSPIPNNPNTNLITIPQFHLHTSPFSSQNSSSILSQYNQLTILQCLLTLVSNIFKQIQLEYFLKNYDWNFMEQDICLISIKYLYQFIQNVDNQQRIEYQLFKKCLIVINKRIQTFLQINSQQKLITNSKTIKKSPQQQNKTKSPLLQNQQQRKYIHINKQQTKQKKQFYELKKKQYFSFVQKINKKPKQIFKIIQQLNQNKQLQIKQDYIQKCVRILKKSIHVDNKSMIDFLASNNPQSDQILQKYLQSFIRNTKIDTNIHSEYTPCTTSTLEHFLRYIISNFFLSGQSQQVTRFIDKTTSQYYKHQSATHSIFKNSDSIYTFANAIIILNTDHHNHKNQKKMTLQSFMKMCQKINSGQNLNQQMLKQIYNNIKQSQIHTFRNRYNMEKINLQCWLDIVNDYQSIGIGYYDHDMNQITTQLPKSKNTYPIQYISNTTFRQYANQLLLSVIDQKQTQKLQLMVQRFQYDDRKFDCEIIQKIRNMIQNKKHIAMSILQKVYQSANFSPSTKKLDDKTISYCWLSTNIIQNFYQSIPYSKIVQYLLKTWKISNILKDNLFIRQSLEFKSIKKMLKQYKKKQNKKSIMDLFSKFLTSKNSQNQQDQIQMQSKDNNNTTNTRKKPNISNSSFILFKLIMRNYPSRTRAAQTVLLNIRHQQSRIYQQFISCLYLIFHLIYGQPKTRKSLQQPKSSSTSQYDNQININNNDVEYQSIQIAINLLYDFFCITQPHKIGTRITSLKTKNIQKYQFIYSYAQYWSLLILFQFSISSYEKCTSQNTHKKRNKICQKFPQIYDKCLSLLPKLNQNILNNFIQIIDINGINYQFMINKLNISNQFINQLSNIIDYYGIKFKYITNFNKDNISNKQIIKQKNQIKLQINLQQQKIQNQTHQNVQKYMKQLNVTNSSSSLTHQNCQTEQKKQKQKIKQFNENLANLNTTEDLSLQQNTHQVQQPKNTQQDKPNNPNTNDPNNKTPNLPQNQLNLNHPTPQNQKPQQPSLKIPENNQQKKIQNNQQVNFYNFML